MTQQGTDTTPSQRAPEVPVESLFEGSPVAVAVLDEGGAIGMANTAFAHLLGGDASQVVGRDFGEFLVELGPADVDFKAALRSATPVAGWVPCTLATAEGRWLSAKCHMQVDRVSGQDVRVVVHVLDLTEQARADRAVAELIESEATYRQSMMESAVPTALLDLNGIVTESNAALEEHLSTPREHLVGVALDGFMSLSVRRSFHRAWDAFLTGRQETLRIRGEWVDGTGRRLWSDVSASLIQEGVRTSHVVLQVIDVSAEQRALDQLAYRSSHDALTGLANRAEVIAAVLAAGDRSATAGTYAAVFFIDVDNFKQINDGLNHQAGDEVLVAIAQRLQAALRPQDMVGRLGGDEFVVVLDDVADPAAVTGVAEALRRAVAATLTVGGVRLVPTVSVGVAVGRGRVDAMALLREADDALREAKRHGRNRCETYSSAMSQSASDRLGLEATIREALHERRIEAHFQPVVDLATGRLVGYEALARLRQVSGDVAPNADFIAVAEQSGLIVPVGREVIAQAIEAATHLGPEIRMAVNASGPQLNDPRFADDLIGSLYSHGLDPRRLIIEVTETTILHLAHWAHAAIARLVALGIGLHVDDFGTGFSSIAHLHDLPVTGMKLDRSFTSELSSRSSPAYRLAEGLAALADSLRLTTIAEGVETPLQRQLLQESGWQCGQGWLFGRAEPSVL